MNLGWLWFNHFPPDLPLTAAERAKARRMAAEHWKREPNYFGARRLYLQVFVPIAVIAIGAIITAILFRKQLPVHVHFFYGAIFYPGITWAVHRSRRPFIRKALNDLDHPVCMACGYLLHGCSSERCPECGLVRVKSCIRVLSAAELGDPVTVQMMGNLGYAICSRCGAVWFEGKEHFLGCPMCKIERGTTAEFSP